MYCSANCSCLFDSDSASSSFSCISASCLSKWDILSRSGLNWKKILIVNNLKHEFNIIRKNLKYDGRYCHWFLGLVRDLGYDVNFYFGVIKKTKNFFWHFSNPLVAFYQGMLSVLGIAGYKWVPFFLVFNRPLVLWKNILSF